MLPTDPWPAWILFAAALVQTVAAIIQVGQSRRRPGTARAGTGVSTGVRFGLAALVLEFGGWLAARQFTDGPFLVRVGVFAPAILLGGIAFFRCLGNLLASPAPPPPPRRHNVPLDPRKIGAWHTVERQEQERYERALEESRQSPSLVFSLVLGAAGALAVVGTSLQLAGVLS